MRCSYSALRDTRVRTAQVERSAGLEAWTMSAQVQKEFDNLVKELIDADGLPPAEAVQQAVESINEAGLETEHLWLGLDEEERAQRQRMDKWIKELKDASNGDTSMGDALSALNGLKLLCKLSGERGTRASGYIAHHSFNVILALLAVRAEEKEEDEEKEDEDDEDDDDDEDDEDMVEEGWAEALGLLEVLLAVYPGSSKVMSDAGSEALLGLLTEKTSDRAVLRKIMAVMRALCAATGEGGTKAREKLVQGGGLETLKQTRDRLKGNEKNASMTAEVETTIAAIEAP